MTQKTLGYVALEWTCPSCHKRNPGSVKACQSCGAAMPEDAQFELPPEQKLDTSAETAAQVAAGPDVICPYCGARNRGNALKCVGCGGDLSEAARRAQGQILGAFQAGAAAEVTCPHCGAKNPASATACAQCGGALEREASALPVPSDAPPAKGKGKFLGLGCLVLVILGVILASQLLRGRGQHSATVQEVQWSYAVEVQELQPVTREAWHDELPAGARVGECVKKVRRTQAQPAPGATEVCGTPYVQDTGTGKGKVVQDCVYQVTDDWCRYVVDEWRSLGVREVAGGRDLNPSWPAISLPANQRQGARVERYRVVLLADDEAYIYQPKDLAAFLRFTPGSRWRITTNALGGISAIEPE